MKNKMVKINDGSGIAPGRGKSTWDFIVDGQCPFDFHRGIDDTVCPGDCPNGSGLCSEYRRIKEVGYGN